MIDGQPKHSMSMVLQMKDPVIIGTGKGNLSGFDSTLSDKQIQEAIMLATDNLVNQLNNTTWSVESTNHVPGRDDSYVVQRADDVHAYDLYCKCKGWQFKRGEKDCKHCEAVRQSMANNLAKATNNWKQTTKPLRITKPKTTKPKTTKRISKTKTENKVKCWHCNDPDQKINEDEMWYCTK